MLKEQEASEKFRMETYMYPTGFEPALNLMQTGADYSDLQWVMAEFDVNGY